jgi:glucose-1-phosphate thymidylyltransferase
MKGILLHAGHGTRLRPLTHTGPKQLLPIANRPMSEYCIESMKETGIVDIAIIIGGTGSQKVKDYYGDGTKFGVNIKYIHQDFPRGISHAISLCEDFIDNEKFLVFLGDNIIQKSIKDFSINFEKSNAAASILLCEVDNPSRFGIADIQNGEIKKIMEKPQDPPTNLAVTGIYFLTPIIFNIIKRLKPSPRNELEITDALDMLLNENNIITYNMITNYWKDTGTPEDIIHANGIILENISAYFHGKDDGTNAIQGNIMIGKNSIIKNNSTLNGPIIIGKNCIIDGSTIGPHTSIGDNSIVSDCNLQNSIIMSNCEIKGDIKIKNSIISYNASIISNPINIEKTFLLGEGTKLII